MKSSKRTTRTLDCGSSATAFERARSALASRAKLAEICRIPPRQRSLSAATERLLQIARSARGKGGSRATAVHGVPCLPHGVPDLPHRKPGIPHGVIGIFIIASGLFCSAVPAAAAAAASSSTTTSATYTTTSTTRTTTSATSATTFGIVVPYTIFDPDNDPDKHVHPDYAALFVQFDTALNNGDAYSYFDNTTGSLAWAQSYMQMAYVRMYKSTSDTQWLDKLVTQFDRVLACRDDRLGRIDFSAKRPRKGWGSTSFDKSGRWHVYVVHTGMICNAPAEFVRLVKSDPALAAKYGATADRYLAELEAMVADANTDFRTSGTMGYFVDPTMGDGGIIPLNMSNAMGCVLVELYRATGKAEYRGQATQLANFFHSCLEERRSVAWVWEYWPKNANQPVREGAAEDISHAAINVEFAVRCCQAGIRFSREEMRNFGGTWQSLVTKLEGSGREKRAYADRVDGTDIPGADYIPQAAGRWYPLVATLPPHQQRLFRDAITPAFAGQRITLPSQALGLANLAPLAQP